MASLTTQHINRAGATITPVPATGGGDAMECGRDCFLMVVNGGSQITVTINVPSSRVHEANVAIASPQITVAGSTTKYIGPIDAETFMDPTTGLASISYTGVGSVTVAACKLDQG